MRRGAPPGDRGPTGNGGLLTPVEFAVLVSGVTSMGLEILAGRLVAPEFGNSVFTWGSVIGVFLTALSLGYALGGRRADRASPAAIRAVLVGSASFVAFVALAGGAVLDAADALALPGRFAPLLPVAVLFGPPVFLLGFISPFAAELSGRKSAGGAAGRVYALGTVGSIAGAFGTTFLLVPSVGVLGIEIGFGLLLLFAAAAVAPFRPVRGNWQAVAAALVVVVALTAAGSGVSAGKTVVYETETPYQHLRVTDHGGVRTLYLDGAPQSAMYVDGREGYAFEYTRYFHLPLLMQDDVDRVLFIGGGGFSGPKRFLAEYEDVRVDVVEIDPAVIRVAKEYFGVEPSPRLSIHNADGREFLERTSRTYDVIVLDAYRSDRAPFHLTTVEFMRLAASRLDEDGALVANVISAERGGASAFYRAELKTMDRAFPHVYAFPTVDTPFLQNIELVATKREDGFTQTELRRRNDEREIGIDLSGAISRYRAAEDVRTDDVPVLRDDRAPVDGLIDAQLGRRYVVARGDAPNGSAPATRGA